MTKKSDPCIKAIKLLQKGDKDGSLKNLLRCKKQIKQQMRKSSPEYRKELKIKLVRVLRIEGQIYFSNKKYGRAETIFIEAKLMTKDYDMEREIISIVAHLDYALALIALVREQFQKCIELFNLSRDNFIESKNYEDTIEVSFRLIDLHIQQNEFKIALECCNQIKKMNKKIKNKSLKKKIHANELIKEGVILGHLGNSKALDLLYKAKEIFHKINDIEGEIKTILEISSVNTIEVKEAKELCFEGLNIAREADSAKYKGSILTKLGILFLTSGEFEKGEEYLLSGLKFRLEVDDKSGTAQTLSELSRIALLTARNENDLKKAKDFASQSLELYQEINQDYGKAQVLELLGSINSKLGNHDEAKSQISSGRKIFKSYKDQNAEARMLTQLGIILDQQNRREEAILVLEKAIKLYLRKTNKQGLAEVYQLLGIFTDDKFEAIAFLKKSRAYYSEIINNNVQLLPIIHTLDKRINDLECS